MYGAWLLPTLIAMISHKKALVVVGAGVAFALILLALLYSGSYSGGEVAGDASGEAGTDQSEPPAVSVPPEMDSAARPASMPSFAELEAGPERKEAFIDYVVPVVRSVNREVRQRRRALQRIEQDRARGHGPDAPARDWLAHMTRRYRVRAQGLEKRLEVLKSRVDTIPVSLAVAQAALESNWGTSRFARQGNNLFGKWCFSPGCGIAPARRAEGASHEVAAYDDVAEATRDYMHHLNSHPVYEPLRERRATARSEGVPPRGSDLASGLEKYSAKGEEYINYIRQVINANDLDRLDGGGG